MGEICIKCEGYMREIPTQFCYHCSVNIRYILIKCCSMRIHDTFKPDICQECAPYTVYFPCIGLYNGFNLVINPKFMWDKSGISIPCKIPMIINKQKNKRKETQQPKDTLE